MFAEVAMLALKSCFNIWKLGNADMRPKYFFIYKQYSVSIWYDNYKNI